MSIFYNADFWLKPRSYEDGWPLDIVPVVKAAIQLAAKLGEGLRNSYYFRWEEEDKRVIHEKMRVLGALCYREPMNYRRDRSPVEEAIFDDIIPYMRSTGLKLPANVGEPLDRLDDELILYRENLQREREAITWPENTLQEHFMAAVASVKEGCFTEEHEPLFFAAAYARDAVFESWTPETLRGYFEAVEGIQTHEDYPKWVERANYELSEMDQPFIVAEKIEDLKDELEIQSLWFKTTERTHEV